MLGSGESLFFVQKTGRKDMYPDVVSLAAGEKKTGLELRMPSARHIPGKLTGSPKIPIEVVEVTAETERLDFDISKVAPGRVRGRGRVSSPAPFGRLVVLAAPLPSSNVRWGYLKYDGPHCAVGLDGRYGIMAPGGERNLVVLDVPTGAMLYRTMEPIRIVSNEAIDIDLEVPASRVDVQLELEGEDGGRPYLLEICPDPSNWPTGIADNAERAEIRNSGMELVLGSWERSCTLYLPEAARDSACGRQGTWRPVTHPAPASTSPSPRKPAMRTSRNVPASCATRGPTPRSHQDLPPFW